MASAGDTINRTIEQARGRKVDQRTDISSFGVVVYRLLAGKLPFEGDYDAVITSSIINTDPRWEDIHDENLRTVVQVTHSRFHILVESHA